MEAPELNKIEVGNNIENTELSLIRDLKVDAFDVNTNKENKEEMKEALKTTTINVITSAPDVTPKTKETKTLSEIATQFDQYVTQWEWWKLKVIEEKTDTPAWITYIIENPLNNDLAYLIQKLSGLIAYQTAKAYTENELEAIDVKEDKAFGNQTKRALAGLKNWIESEWDYTNVAEWLTYQGEYLDKTFIDWVISAQNTEETKNAALVKYNLQYVNGAIIPKDGYEFIDPYSNNLATKQSPTTETTTETWTTETTGWIEIEDIKDVDVADLVKKYPKYFDLSKFTEETIANLGSLLLDWDKRETFFSMIILSSNFWNNNKFKLWADEIQLLIDAMNNDYMDYSDSYKVFHIHNNRSSDEENDFVGMKVVNGKKTLVKYGDIWDTPVFEVDGTGIIDDYRFDSIETFFMWLKNNREIPDEENEGTIDAYKNRFDPIIDDETLKQTIGAIEKDDEKKRTFISLLNLDDTFWGNYKLTLEDISAFKKWTAKGTFDYATGSDTVFHEYTDDPENDYNTLQAWKIVNVWDQWSAKVFEVDGTGTIDDERFDSVDAFFVRLKKEIK